MNNKEIKINMDINELEIDKQVCEETAKRISEIMGKEIDKRIVKNLDDKTLCEFKEMIEAEIKDRWWLLDIGGLRNFQEKQD